MEQSGTPQVEQNANTGTKDDSFASWLFRHISVLDKPLGLLEIRPDLLACTLPNGGAVMRAVDLESGCKVAVGVWPEATGEIQCVPLLSVAADFEAQSVGIIVKEATHDLKSAVRWLNEIASPKTTFFLLEADISGTSSKDYAVKFNVAQRPATWNYVLDRTWEASQVLEKKRFYWEFWSEFNQFAFQQDTEFSQSFKQGYATINSRYALASGKNKRIWLGVNAGGRDRIGILVCEVPPFDNWFETIPDHKAQMEAEIRQSITVTNTPSEKGFWVFKANCPIDDKSRWPEYAQWFITMAPKVCTAMQKLDF